MHFCIILRKTDEELNSLQAIIDENQIEYDELAEIRSELASNEEEIKSRLNDIKTESTQLENNLSQYRSERQRLSRDDILGNIRPFHGARSNKPSRIGFVCF